MGNRRPDFYQHTIPEFLLMSEVDPLLIRPQRRFSVWRFLREIAWVTVFVLVLYLVVNVAIPRFVVEGHSMEPNLHSSEYVMVSRVHYLLEDPQRGDVVVFHLDAENDLIKRIVALPGEKVVMKDGRIAIDGVLLDEPYVMELCHLATCRHREWLLAEDEYFVLGDNRNHSHDSHDFGPIQREQIVGKAWVRYWPPESWSFFTP